MKLLEVLNSSTSALKGNGIEDARLNVELMLCHIFSCDRVKLYLEFEKPLSAGELDIIRNMLRRRLKGEPLQYILGETEFMDCRILVNPSVLIPRPETECLVEVLIDDIKSKQLTDVKILEVGTGSGCIPIAVSKELSRLNVKHKIVSLEISKSAIETAEQNKKINDIADDQLTIVERDFLKMNKLSNQINYLISNPPYINATDYKLLDKAISGFEPKVALTDESDGLTFYRKFLHILSEATYKFSCIFEIAYDLSEKLEDLMKENSLTDYYFYKDLNGIERVLKIG